MDPAPPIPRRQAGFTFVELLLAIALGALVAGILAAMLHGLLVAGAGQSSRLQGPHAARRALTTLAREAACAFPPPGAELAAVELATSTEPGKPEVRLAFYAPVAAEQARAGTAYDLHHVVYEVHRQEEGRRVLQRISAPCSGPFTNTYVTNPLLAGHFSLEIAAVTNDAIHAAWPLPDAESSHLPSSLRLTLLLPQTAPLQTEALIQAAAGMPSPVRSPAGEEK
jgi:prepilin-type N-terminal cleavage/methylation domain-containing protein